jgi:hypothetical protein
MMTMKNRYVRTGSYGKTVQAPEPVIGITKTKYGYAISRNGNVGGVTEELIRRDLGMVIVNQWDWNLEKFGGKNMMGTVFFETEGQAMNALIWIKSEMARGDNIG